MSCLRLLIHLIRTVFITVRRLLVNMFKYLWIAWWWKNDE
nr:MAG TPA: hypothetical protein [Bacteriophage sp.]